MSEQLELEQSRKEPIFDTTIGPQTSASEIRSYNAEFVTRYCTVIFFGQAILPNQAMVEAAGTATLLEIGARRFIVTNDHILSEYEKRAAGRSSVHFQVGRAAFSPDDRLIDRSSSSDLCTFAADELDINDRLPIDPIPPLSFYSTETWPPPMPKAGEQLAWGGFPSSLKHKDQGIHYNVPLTFAGARVTRMEERFIVVNLDPDRKDLTVHYGEGRDAQSPELRELGGMSGGPVFVDRRESIRLLLVAVISEYSELVNQIRMSRLDLIKEDGTIR